MGSQEKSVVVLAQHAAGGRYLLGVSVSDGMATVSSMPPEEAKMEC